MFSEDETVGWVTRGITYMGRVVSSNERITIVLVTSTDKKSKDIGRKVGVATNSLQKLRDVSNASA